MEDRPRRIKAAVLPYDDCDVDSMLNDLVTCGFIIRYEVSSERFIEVVNFAKHQAPNVKEQPSTIPAPDKHHASTVQASQERKGIRKDIRPKRSKPERSLDGFDEWWNEQTRKEGKGNARKSYASALSKTDAASLLAGWIRSKTQYEREGRARDKYPLPATWLNQERWEDDYADVTVKHEDTYADLGRVF